jgi:hypothetical protein
MLEAGGVVFFGLSWVVAVLSLFSHSILFFLLITILLARLSLSTVMASLSIVLPAEAGISRSF